MFSRFEFPRGWYWWTMRQSPRAWLGISLFPFVFKKACVGVSCLGSRYVTDGRRDSDAESQVSLLAVSRPLGAIVLVSRLWRTFPCKFGANSAEMCWIFLPQWCLIGHPVSLQDWNIEEDLYPGARPAMKSMKLGPDREGRCEKAGVVLQQ